MTIGRLIREPSEDVGTFGRLTFDFGLTVRTLELPWRENARAVSCIPTGRYECVWRHSPRFGDCYHVLDVPKRSDILIHAGNLAGDVAKGFKSDVQGCILVGTGDGLIDGQRGIIRSRTALFNLHSALREAPFVLEIS